MNEPFRVDERIALVTGGSGLLGDAIARALAHAGARVIVSGRDRSKLQRTAAAVGGIAIDADLASEGSIADLFAQIEREVGGLDILVNNAGTASAAGLEELTADELQRVFAVNVAAPALCARHAAASMSTRGGGKVVNIGSIYGTVAADQGLYDGAEMVRCSPAYAASKSALVNLTRDLAIRLAPLNVQVNLVSPGGIEAGQPQSFHDRYVARTPAGRMGKPDDVVGTVVYLCSPASDYVTGQNIHVDGGFTSW
jgi:2-dehydro-3-deoxy-D-gluconate 5-dehydrogenase